MSVRGSRRLWTWVVVASVVLVCAGVLTALVLTRPAMDVALVSGKWLGSYGEGTIELDLRPDGTYQERIYNLGDHSDVEHDGRWSVNSGKGTVGLVGFRIPTSDSGEYSFSFLQIHIVCDFLGRPVVLEWIEQFRLTRMSQ